MIETIEEWLQFAARNMPAVWLFVTVVVSQITVQSVRGFIRGAFHNLAQFWRTTIYSVIAILITFALSRYMLRESFDDGEATRFAIAIALLQLAGYRLLQSWAINSGKEWLIRWFKLRKVRGDDGEEKYLDENNETVGWNRRKDDV